MAVTSKVNHKRYSKKVDHTPLPWSWCQREKVSDVPSQKSEIPFSIHHNIGGGVAPIADIVNFPDSCTSGRVARMRADAEFIAVAANFHYKLLNALKAVQPLLPEDTRLKITDLLDEVKKGVQGDE